MKLNVFGKDGVVQKYNYVLQVLPGYVSTCATTGSLCMLYIACMWLVAYHHYHTVNDGLTWKLFFGVLLVRLARITMRMV